MTQPRYYHSLSFAPAIVNSIKKLQKQFGKGLPLFVCILLLVWHNHFLVAVHYSPRLSCSWYLVLTNHFLIDLRPSPKSSSIYWQWSLKMKGISPFGTYTPRELTQPIPHHSPLFTQMIINVLIRIMEQNAINNPFWVISATWSYTTTSSLLSILHPNYLWWIDHNYEKILQGIFLLSCSCPLLSHN